MPSPFPGMDPYLELDWGDFHSRIASLATEQINERLPNDLACRSEKRIVVSSPESFTRGIVPDVSIYELPDSTEFESGGGTATAVAEEVLVKLPAYEFPQHSLNIIDLGTGGRVITTIEFVSPVNKIRGEGLTQYLQKQDECRNAGVNLIEIDLCRAGDRELIFPIASLTTDQKSTYAAVVRRSRRPYEISFHRLPLQRPLGGIPIPLRDSDQEILLELQPLVERVYRTGRYGGPGLYQRELKPSFNDDDAKWIQTIIDNEIKR
ncbi:MAG: DUF4058 family protein [Planctomycetota bacterium]